jgi:hypothetical protein
LVEAVLDVRVRQAPRGGTSAWIAADLKEVHNHFSERISCSVGRLGFTAEFGLGSGEFSALAGHRTALFQLRADQPHPHLGGGLLCSLEFPHQLRDDSQVRELCVRLNNLEMEARDLPPHFGAWCEGKSGENLAYVSFYSNVLHPISGIAVNAVSWAFSRAQWANAGLGGIGGRD